MELVNLSACKGGAPKHPSAHVPQYGLPSLVFRHAQGKGFPARIGIGDGAGGIDCRQAFAGTLHFQVVHDDDAACIRAEQVGRLDIVLGTDKRQANELAIAGNRGGEGPGCPQANGRCTAVRAVALRNEAIWIEPSIVHGACGRDRELCIFCQLNGQVKEQGRCKWSGGTAQKDSGHYAVSFIQGDLRDRNVEIQAVRGQGVGGLSGANRCQEDEVQEGMEDLSGTGIEQPPECFEFVHDLMVIDESI